MRSWRWTAVLAFVVVASTSIHTPIARSQEDDPGAGGNSDAGAPPANAGPISAPPDAEDARIKWLAQNIDARLAQRPLLAKARVGIVARDLVSGKVLYERDPNGRYNVASNTKIITAAAALSLLGPGFRMRTSLLVERDALREPGVIRGDLYIRSAADPMMGVSTLEGLARDLAHQGIKRVTGSLVIDDTYFDRQYLPPKFDEQKKSLAHYRAPIGAVSFNLNRIYVIIRPDPSGVGPATVFADPPSRYVRVRSQIETIETGRTRLDVSAKTRRDSYELEFTGQLRWNAPMRRLKYRVPDPVQYFGSTFHNILRRHGVRVSGKRVRSGKAPRRHRVVTYHDSSRLAVLLRGLGKMSNNYMAEMILKTIGAETKQGDAPATWADGLRAVRGWLVDAAGLEAGKFRYDNGSGLFDSSEFTPAQIVAVLAAAHRDFRVFPDLASSLAIAGTDGTLRRRMTKTPARGLVRAKTGTLARVITLSGYAARDTRRPIAFSVLVNDLPKRKRWHARRAARTLSNEVSDLLAVYAGADL